MTKFVGIWPVMALALLMIAGCGGQKAAPKGQQGGVTAPNGAVAPRDAPASGEKQAADAKKPGDPATATGRPAAPGAKAGEAKKPGAPGRPAGAPPGAPVAKPAAKVDIPVYPGAKPVAGKDGKGPGPGMKEYSTAAKFDDVVKWYRKNFKAQESPVHPDAKGKMAAFRSINEKTGDVRIVNVAQFDKGVRIAMAQLTLPKDAAARLKNDKGGPPEMPKDVKMVRDKDKAAAQIGMPLYPDGELKNGVIVTRDKVPDMRQIGVELVSADSPKKVFDWYKGQLKGEKLHEEKSEKGDAFALMYEHEKERTLYRIMTGKVQDDTVIQLVRMKVPPGPPPGGPRPGTPPKAKP
jgi:hypothetical protein